jgi:hypothetical protein
MYTTTTTTTTKLGDKKEERGQVGAEEDRNHRS